MKKQILIFACAAIACTIGISAAQGQTPATNNASPSTEGQPKSAATVSANRVAGEVAAIDQAAGAITLKADGGSAVIVLFNDKTAYYRAKSDALARAGTAAITPADMVKITLSEVGSGDRVVVIGRVAEDQKSVTARVLIVATKADIAQKHERDREEWRRRGIVGTVSAVNPETKEITLSVRSREGVQPVVVAAGGEKIFYRRYAPDSVKFADAKASSFAELKPGDQVRALGERSADNARFTPEEIVSGSFRQLVGTVTKVDAATNQITITTQDKRPLTVIVNGDSNLRRLPPMMAQMMAQRAAGGGGGQMGGGANGQGRPRGEGGGRPPAQAAGDEAGAGGGGGGGGARRGMRGGGGGFDAQDMLERVPQLTLAELKPGDMIIVSSTTGADPTRITAIALLAGVDAIINAVPARPAGPAQASGQNLGLPGGIDLGIGLP
ncbi:MAG: hypothetical protein ACR2G4_00055 [Pyrinomonadaceae bacterium]